MTARTRNTTDKIFGKERFAPIEKFSLGKLPTLKETIDRCLTFKNYKTDGIIRAVSEELLNLWITYNAHPTSVNGISKRLKTMIVEFNRLVRYDKKSRGKKYKKDVDIFFKTASTFFDFYQHDSMHFSNTEKKHMLEMAEPDFQFYEDQKIIRVQYCTLK